MFTSSSRRRLPPFVASGVTSCAQTLLGGDLLSEVMRDVLVPLQNDGARLTVELSIEAESAQGIKPGTLQQKVMQTLSQIDAEVLEERKE